MVLLFRPVKSAIQNALDRAFYRDRYDYRRALVGIRARSEQRPRPRIAWASGWCARHPETSSSIAWRCMLLDETIRRLHVDPRRGFRRSHGAEPGPSSRQMVGDPGRRARRWRSTRRRAGGRVPGRGDRVLARRPGVHYFVPCVSKGGTIAVLALGQTAAGRAAQQRRHGAVVGGGGAGCDGARERSPVPPAAAQGRRARAAAAVQREHPGIAR